MREGITRDGSYLYPGFPYTHFKNLSDEDLEALYVYLMTLEPVAYTPPDNAMHFPFNLRFLQWGWLLLFFDGKPMHPAPQQSDAWNRGAYLASLAGPAEIDGAGGRAGQFIEAAHKADRDPIEFRLEKLKP